MQVLSYSRYIRTKIGAYLVMLFIAVSVWVVIVQYQLHVMRQFEETEKGVLGLQSDLTVLQGDIQRIREAYTLWKQMDTQKFAAQGLQIENAKRIIESVSTANHINKLEVSLSNPVVRTDYANNQYVQVEYSEIAIDCSAYTDEAIFDFLTALTNTMPGYVQIKDMDLSNPRTITPEILQGIAQGNYRDLVQARVLLIWQEVRKIRIRGP